MEFVMCAIGLIVAEQVVVRLQFGTRTEHIKTNERPPNRLLPLHNRLILLILYELTGKAKENSPVIGRIFNIHIKITY